MRRTIWVGLLWMAGCGGGGLTTDAGTRGDATGPCMLGGQLELLWSDAGTCGQAPIVVLTLAPDASVISASAHVPLGVSVPLVPCTSHAVPSASCVWSLDVTCDGAHGEHLAIAGVISTSTGDWAGSDVSVTLTGAPPGRLSCDATGPARH